MNAFRNDPQVMNLRTRSRTAGRTPSDSSRKRSRTALNRKDNDGAIEILKKLDLYLTRAEADVMQDTVRNLFKEKINDLRTQFALAVQDHRWGEAVRIGELIVRDFPNSGIAQEVKGRLDALRQRATEPAQTAGV
jgi:hypothetical protein